MDDYYILGPPEEILKAYGSFARRCQSDGSLSLNFDKGKFIYFHKNGLGKDILEKAKTLSLKIKTKAVKILGAPVGIEKKSVSDLAVKDTQKYKIILERLQNENLPDYVTDPILRIGGTPSFNYLSRVVPPENLKEAAILFDSWSRDTFLVKHNLLNEKLQIGIWDQLSLPIT